MRARAMCRLLLALALGLGSGPLARAGPDARGGREDLSETVEIGVIAVVATSLLALLGAGVSNGLRRRRRLRERERHRKAVLLAVQPWLDGRRRAEGKRRVGTIDEVRGKDRHPSVASPCDPTPAPEVLRGRPAGSALSR